MDIHFQSHICTQEPHTGVHSFHFKQLVNEDYLFPSCHPQESLSVVHITNMGTDTLS